MTPELARIVEPENKVRYFSDPFGRLGQVVTDSGSKANYDLKMQSLKLRMLGYFGVVFILVGAYLFWVRLF